MSLTSAQTQVTLEQYETPGQESIHEPSEEEVIQLHKSGYGPTKISNRTGWSMEKAKKFLKRNGYFYESRCDMERVRETGEEVQELYENTSMTIQEICDELNLNRDYAVGSYKYITDRVGEKSVERDGQLHKMTQKAMEGPPDFYTRDGYEVAYGIDWDQVSYREDINKAEQLLIHRLVAVAEYGFDAVAGKHVHHKNGIRWDNRPENLEPADQKTHMNKHWHKDPLVSQLASASDEDVIEGLLNAGYYDAALAVENGGDS